MSMEVKILSFKYIDFKGNKFKLNVTFQSHEARVPIKAKNIKYSV